MPIVKLASIRVGDRQREDYGDLPDLAASLADSRYGQLQPILVDRGFNLIAGGRRLAAAAILAGAGTPIAGLPAGEVWVEFRDTLSPEHAEAIELEENVRRKQLEWQEEQKAISRLHAYRVKEDPTWNADKTAALIGKSKRTVYNAIELTKALDNNPDIAKADTASGAMKRLERQKQLTGREDAIKVAVLAKGLGMAPKVKGQIIHGDALEGMKELDPESVDAVIFNPPFGVDIESLFTSGGKIYESDDPIDMTLLTEQIVEQAYRVLKPDRWMVMFYPTVRLEDVKGVGTPMWKEMERAISNFQQDMLAKGLSLNLNGLKEDLADICGGMLRRNGFTFQQVPAQWIKPNKRVSSLGDPYAQLNINYESFYFARKGKAVFRKIPPSDTFIFNTPGVDRIHPLEMPVDLWTTILEAVCVGGETIVEPFAGSGSGGEAAINLGLNYTGWELDGDYALHAQTRLVGALAGVLQAPKLTLVQGGSGERKLESHGFVTIDTTHLDNNLFEE